MREGGRLLALAQGELLLPWRLRLVPVCASTEVELSRWLHQGASAPLAVLARRQRHGRGQRQRHWQSPPGGLWLSAALPWQGPAPVQDPSQLPLVVAGAVAAELHRRYPLAGPSAGAGSQPIAPGGGWSRGC